MKVHRLFSIFILITMLFSFGSPPDSAAMAADTLTPSVPVLQVIKTANDAQVNVGEEIGFTMVASNVGGGTAINARLIDRLPTGTTWSVDHPACFITAENWVVCEFGDAPPGDVKTVGITATATEAMCGLVTNRAAYYSDNHPKTASNTAEVIVSCQTPGLILSKTPDAALVNANDPIGFTLTVLNNGSATAENVVLTDQLYAGIGWSDNSSACEIDGSNLLTCAFGNLAVGASASVHISATSNAGMCGLLENTASVSASNISGEVTASANIDIRCRPDLRINKTAADDLVSPGETIRFILEVTSAGIGTVEDAMLQDTLPSAPGLNWTIESVTGGGNCSITSGLLTCDFGSLAAGQTRTVRLASPTTTATCGKIDNTATVTASNEGTTEENNNSDSASITVNCGSLAIVKTADNELIEAGDPIGFTITVANDGDTTVTNVQVQDQLSTLITWSENSAACDISSSNLLTCNFGDLAVGASASVRVTGISNTQMCGLLKNTATATAGNLSGKISDSATVNVNCLPFITLRKIAEDDHIAAGEIARFNIVVKNEGPVAAQNVIITDQLPVVPGGSWTFDNVVGGGLCEINAGTLSCNFGTLDPGESAGVRISTPTTTDSCGLIVNSVTATATNDPLDAFDIAQIVVACGADVAVTKTAERPRIVAGDPAQPARFTITVISIGRDTALGVTLVDELPTYNGLVWTIESVTGGGTCELVGDRILCEFGSMAPGETRTIVISSPTVKESFCWPSADRIIRNFVFVEASNENGQETFDNSAYAEIEVNCFGTDECLPVLYTNNFDTVTPGAPGWTNYRTSISPNRTQTFLGDFSNEDVIFESTNPDPSRYLTVRVKFDLYIIRSWDGNIERVRPTWPVVGPDYWRFGLQNTDGSIYTWLVDTTYTNYSESVRSFFKQSYPTTYPFGSFPSHTGAEAINTMGYQFGGPRDSTYTISFMVPYSKPNLKLLFQGEHLQAINDESWGIDNFEVEWSCAEFIWEPRQYWMPALSSLNPDGPVTAIERKTP